MILPDFKAFPRTGRIVGIDWGARRTGVAVTDASREFVFTRPVINVGRGADLARLISDIVMAENAGAVVFGLPVHSDGTESDMAVDVRRTASVVAERTGVPVAFIEENLTSIAAQESMGRVRRADIKSRLDSEAARVILENAIAIINRMKN